MIILFDYVQWLPLARKKVDAKNYTFYHKTKFFALSEKKSSQEVPSAVSYLNAHVC